MLVIDPTWISKNGGIDGYAFWNNRLLKTLDLSNCKHNMYFKTNAFNGSTITTLLISEGKSIHLGDYSLANTSQLRILENFKLGVNSNPEYAFYNSGVESVIITETAASNASIAKSMFENCKYLSYIDYPEEIVELAERAFKGCSSLTELAIKANVTSIGDLCFDGCINLSSISSYREVAPTTNTFSFGQISSNAYAGYANKNRTDAEGNPYNKLYIPATNSGYLSVDGNGLAG